MRVSDRSTSFPFASKILGAHNLAPIRKRQAPYSSPRGPCFGCPVEARVLTLWGWTGENPAFLNSLQALLKSVCPLSIRQSAHHLQR